MQVLKHSYIHILVLQDSIITYYQLLGNDPPSVATRFSGFVRWLASVPGDYKIIRCLVSLEKLTFKKGYICATGVKSSSCETKYLSGV